MRQFNKKLLIPLILLAALPVIIFAARKTQDSRTRASGSDLSAIRNVWRDYLTGGDYDTSDPTLTTAINAKVSKIADNARLDKQSMITDSNRTYLFSSIPGPVGGPGIANTYQKLEDMALAYSTKGAITDASEKEQLYLSIKDGLIWMNQHWYNKDKCPNNVFARGNAECGQSFPYQMGATQSITNIIILLYDRLGQDTDGAQIISSNLDAVERFYPNGDANRFYPNGMGVHETAGNLALATVPLVLRAAIKQDPLVMQVALNNYQNDFLKYKTSGDGLYADGSFIQHNSHPYNNWYGGLYFRSVAELSYLLFKSGIITDANAPKLYQWYINAFKPLVFNNDAMDMVKGRIATYPRTAVTGADMPNLDALIILSQLDNGAHNDLGMDILSMTNRSTIKSTINTIVWSNALIQDQALNKPLTDYAITKVFPRMDRAVSIKPDFAFAISMSSGRTFNYESINNGENKKGWYMSDGMVYFYNQSNPGQYNDWFWATIDKTKLPGTTVDEQIKLDVNNNYIGKNYDTLLHDYLSPDFHAGGATQDNSYAALGMDLKSALPKPVTAKKSWFLFDNELVALGSGISGTSGTPTETIVENRKIANDGSNKFVVGGADISTPSTISNASWAFLQGTGGYYFPKLPGVASSLTAQKQARSGNWLQLKVDESPDNQTRNYAEIQFNHGVNPTNGKYAYVFLPNQSLDQTIAYSQNPDIQILSDTNVVHAVKENKLGMTDANFWAPGTAGILTASNESTAILKEQNNSLEFSAADPTQKQSSISFEIAKSASSVVSKDVQITITSLSPTIKLSINTASSKGKSYNVQFNLGSISAPPTQPPTQTPTLTPNPTAGPSLTPTQGNTVLHFPSVKLHGIGSGGDNTNPNIPGNLNPLTRTRPFTAEVYDSSGKLIFTSQGNITYNPTTKDFSGDLSISSSVSSGNYLIKVKSDKFLKKQLEGIITINKDVANQMPSVSLVSGDANGDGVLSILDYNLINDCYSDLLPAKNCDSVKKSKTDLSDDGLVNQDDYNLFLRELSVVSGD